MNVGELKKELKKFKSTQKVKIMINDDFFDIDEVLDEVTDDEKVVIIFPK